MQQEFTAADPDNDGTLSKDEYLAVVERRFKAADPDNDGTVSAAEFKDGCWPVSYPTDVLGPVLPTDAAFLALSSTSAFCSTQSGAAIVWSANKR
jgi:hypothetical protein